MDAVIEIINFLVDSSDDDVENEQFFNPNLYEDQDDDLDVVDILQPVGQRIQRVEHIKVVNYIENQVRNYIERDFIMHFRLSPEVVYELVDRFALSPIFTSLRDPAGFAPITPEKHMLTYLWFMGHEAASYRDVADRFGITLSTLHKILSRVTRFLLSIAGNIIKFPTAEEKEITKRFYMQSKQIPGIIGAIDGTHIRIDKPQYDKDSYINRKQYFSVHMQGVVDHKKKFIDVFIGYPGSVHDARVFRESSLFNSLDDLCGGDSFLIGDSAYPCTKHLIVPFRDNGHLNRAQINFNQRLSSCRVIVENSFGCLKQRFRQLYHLKLRNIISIVQVIHACCVLHNLANENDLQLLEDPILDDYRDEEAGNVENDLDEVVDDSRQGRILRDEICRQLAMH